MVAMGAVFGAFLGLAFTLNIEIIFILLITLFISGVIGFSRLRIGKHSPAQVYAGFLLGVVTMFVHYLLF